MHTNQYFFSNFPCATAFLSSTGTPFESLRQLSPFLDAVFASETTKHIIGAGTQIGENAVVQDHVIIGNNCTIMPHALIRPYTVIGDNCVIGHAAEIKHSIVMDKAKVQSFAFVGDSIIGESARIGSGTILANRGFSQKEIEVDVDGEMVSCGSDFFGAIVGEHSRLGANCTTQPGTLIGPHTWVFPATNVWGFIPRNKAVRNEKKIVLADHENVYLKD